MLLYTGSLSEWRPKVSLFYVSVNNTNTSISSQIVTVPNLPRAYAVNLNVLTRHLITECLGHL